MLDGVNLTEKFTKCCESVTNYRTRAIITRSWFETTLDYKPRILGQVQLSLFMSLTSL